MASARHAPSVDSHIVSLVQHHAVLGGMTFMQAVHTDRLGQVIAARVEQLALEDAGAYPEVLARSPEELDRLSEALRESFPTFFAEPAIYSVLRKVILPNLIKKRSSHTLRFWSVGCGSGEELYSIAMTVDMAFCDHGVPVGGWDCQIYGTEPDEMALRTATTAIYDPTAVPPGVLTDAQRARYFERMGRKLRIAEFLRDMATFQIAGIADAQAGPPDADVVFCRDVLLPLSRRAALEAVDRICGRLNEDGYIFLSRPDALSVSQMTALAPMCHGEAVVYAKLPPGVPLPRLPILRPRAAESAARRGAHVSRPVTPLRLSPAQRRMLET
jgi:chemotaxis methyl-accepting protein methylase